MGLSSVSPCDLDREFASRITQLLANPSLQSAREYYDEHIQSKKHDGIKVSYSGEHGKGVCANKDFAEGDLILKDQILSSRLDEDYWQSIGAGASSGCTNERDCHQSGVGSSTGSSGATKGNSTLPQEDNDGHGVIFALEPISKDDEITISYIDEDLPYEERQAQLADYGFTCTCCRCQEEKPN